MAAFTVRMSDTLKKELEKKAKERNIGLGECCRQLLEEALLETSIRDELKSMERLVVRANIGINILGVKNEKNFIETLSRSVKEYYDKEGNEKK